MSEKTTNSCSYPDLLKAKLRNKELLLGTCVQTSDPLVVSSAIEAKPDFLWIDTEHAPIGMESLGLIPVLARIRGVAPVIRVGGNDPVLIKKAFDVGAVGVMIPQVESEKEAAQAVSFSK